MRYGMAVAAIELLHRDLEETDRIITRVLGRYAQYKRAVTGSDRQTEHECLARLFEALDELQNQA